MIRFVLMIGLVLLGGCQTGRPQTAGSSSVDPNFLLPGTFAEQTTVADLQARFGRANVQIVSQSIGDGGSGSSVVLFPDDPTRRAHVSFHDAEALEGLARISVRDRGSRWRGKRGVYIGMSFAELVELNGKSFGFWGFDNEYRGWAHDQWSIVDDSDDGQLGLLDVDESEHMYFGVEFGLRGRAIDVPRDDYPHDEVSLRSNDPRFPRLGELVEVTGFDATTSLDDEW